ncbi:hypothetical protein ED733_001017 [Metarhizium rileyi]|uniref:Uncharacterized protein n=1 Tax=Metarhizium rileyi (strain RCEF 4871) TaxID=1649241 RepID=A0A5C6G1A3_METRR|nr:hypothetical protein ED733_001017 [Metarhizium rileyi]
MRMPISPLAFVASALLLIENSYGESFRNDSPREVFRLDEVEYSELITTTVSRNVRLSFVLDNVRREKVVLDLERNDDLYLNPIVVHHLASDGSVQSIDTVPAGSNLAFRGTAYLEQQERGGKPETWPTAGWARMFFFVQDGQQLGGAGAFIINGFEYHVMTDSAYRKTQSAGEPDMPMQSEGPYLIAWRELAEKPTERHELRRRQQENATCSITELDFNKIYLDPTVVDPDLTRRQNRGLDSLDLGSLVQSTPKCPMSRQIALLGVATDCDYTAHIRNVRKELQHFAEATKPNRKRPGLHKRRRERIEVSGLEYGLQQRRRHPQPSPALQQLEKQHGSGSQRSVVPL